MELFTQHAYFAFQVIQVFLVTTFSSSAAAVVEEVRKEPEKITEILAQNIPKASNFFIPYFMVQGLTIAAGVLSQVVGFVSTLR